MRIYFYRYFVCIYRVYFCEIKLMYNIMVFNSVLFNWYYFLCMLLILLLIMLYDEYGIGMDVFDNIFRVIRELFVLIGN